MQGLALEAAPGRTLPPGAAALLDRPTEGGALPEIFPWQLMGCDAARALQPALLPLQVASLVLGPPTHLQQVVESSWRVRCATSPCAVSGWMDVSWWEELVMLSITPACPVP